VDIRVRDGFTQARQSGLDSTKARIVDAGKKIEEAGGYAAKKYWNAGRAALRRSAGTMRFDLNIIASSKSGPARKETMKQNKQFLMDLDNFDLAMAKKDTAAALVHQHVLLHQRFGLMFLPIRLPLRR